MRLQRLIDEQPPLLRPLRHHMDMLVIDHMRCTLRVAELCVILIQKPLVALLELYPVIVQLGVHPFCRLAIILRDLRHREC